MPATTTEWQDALERIKRDLGEMISSHGRQVADHLDKQDGKIEKISLHLARQDERMELVTTGMRELQISIEGTVEHREIGLRHKMDDMTRNVSTLLKQRAWWGRIFLSLIGAIFLAATGWAFTLIHLSK